MNIAPHDALPRTSIIDLLAPSQGGVVGEGAQAAGFDRLLAEPSASGPPPSASTRASHHSSSARSEQQPSETSPSPATSPSEELKREDESGAHRPAESQGASAESTEDAGDDREKDGTNVVQAANAVLVVPQVNLSLEAPVETIEAGEIPGAGEEMVSDEEPGQPIATANPAAAAAETGVRVVPRIVETPVAPADAAMASASPTSQSAEEVLAAAAGQELATAKSVDDPVPETKTPESGHDGAIAAEAMFPASANDRSPAEDRQSRRRQGNVQPAQEDAGQPVRSTAGSILEPPAATTIAEAAAPATEQLAAESSPQAGAGDPGPASPAASPTSAVNPSSPAHWRLPPEILSASSPRGSREVSGPPIDAQRILTRVARAFVLAQDGGGELRLRLSPAELGSLRLEVRVQEGVLTARVEAETPAARTVLIENLPALRERLAEQGVRIERFDVDLMQHSPGGTPDHSRQQREPDVAPPNTIHERIRTRPQVAEGVAPRAVMASDLDARRLNIVV